MGKDSGPPDSEVKKAMVYPGMEKKLDRAINEAQWLHQNEPYQQIDLSSGQKQAIQYATQLGLGAPGQMQGGIDFARMIGGGGLFGMGDPYAGAYGGPQAAGVVSNPNVRLARGGVMAPPSGHGGPQIAGDPTNQLMRGMTLSEKAGTARPGGGDGYPPGGAHPYMAAGDPSAMWAAPPSGGQAGAIQRAMAGVPADARTVSQGAGGAGVGMAGLGMRSIVPGQDVLGRLAQGQGIPQGQLGTLNALTARAAGGNGGMDYMQEAARGGYLGGNPYQEAVIAEMNRGATQSYQDAVASTEGRLARAGRLGGDPSNAEMTLKGDASRQLADAMAANEARVRYGDYATERGYQQAAGMAMPGAYNANLSTAAGIAGQADQSSLARLQAQMQAAQMAGQGFRSDIATSLGASGQMGAMLAQQQQPLNTALQMGEVGRQARERNANQDWEGLQRYAGLLGAINGSVINPGGGAAVQSNYQAPWQQYLGTGLAVAGTAAMFMSDRRVKDRVKKVGNLPVYEWNYKWEPKGAPRHLGPMAQELEKLLPGSTGRTPEGIMTVPAVPFG